MLLVSMQNVKFWEIAAEVTQPLIDPNQGAPTNHYSSFTGLAVSAAPLAWTFVGSPSPWGHCRDTCARIPRDTAARWRVVNFIFSLEKLRSAPPEVRRWALREIAGAATMLCRSGEDPHRVQVLVGAFTEAEQRFKPISAVSFGPFRLLLHQRLLLEGGKPLNLGSRAFDILIALLERPGELTTKEELISRVWSGTHVSNENLKSQVAVLRHALRDGHDGRRYLVTARGQGYRFVAPVRVED